MTIIPAEVNDYVIWRGGTFQEVIQFPSTTDLTGFTAILKLSNSTELNASNGGTIVDPAEKTVTLYISDEDTKTIQGSTPGSPKSVKYILFLETPGGNRDTYMYGRISISGI